MTVFSTVTNVSVIVYYENKGGVKKDGAAEEEREMQLKDFHLECNYSCRAALGSHVFIQLCG